MNTMRIALCCAAVGWMTADARAQLGTYGAPDPIAWSQDTLPAGNMPMVATRTTYISTSDGAATIPATPSQGASGLGPMISEPGPAAGATGSQTSVMPSSGNCNNAGDNSGGMDGWDNCCCCSAWYSTFDFLYMGRNAPNTLYMSYQWGAAVNQAHFDNFDWTPGGQVTFGYRFGCCCDWAIQATYWGLAESDTDSQPVLNTPPGAPFTWGTPLTMGLVDIVGTVGGSPNGTQSAADFFDNSPNQHVWRAWQAQNVEVNLVKTVCGGSCSPVSVDFLVGFRWFRFQDGLIFGSEHPFDGTAYGGDWIYLNDHITNDLWGAQAGFDMSYRFLSCWKAFIRPEVGIFNNHTQLNYNMYAVNATTGQQYQASSETYANPNYPVHATGNDFAFLTQVDVGLDWQLTRHLSLEGGYRVVAVTGVAVADDQVPFYGNDTQAIANIQHNASLLLDGAFVGGTITW